MKLNAAITLDSGMDTWLRRFAWDNRWRVAPVHDLDDLIQDGYVCFVKCRNAYPDVRERRHFMKLFQVAFRNHVTDLSNKNRGVMNDTPTAKELRGERNVVLLCDYLDPNKNSEAQRDKLFGIVGPDAEFLVFLKQARGVVRRAIDLFISDDGMATMLRFPQQQREGTNTYLCRLLDIDPHRFDIVALVTSFLRGTGCYYLHHRSM